ncbi:MAG: TetR family transcriptional regulator [Methylotenera sp.]|uniref:TetR family transcriptional regulator n=1 Tax=Methylotenera sp. TaxID=2051956 RepID=UPI000D477D2F|nr:TetR family transcriptional regulator [Methylotenera sp.]MDP3211837.1 TetR family transcriptional regulator [Methylotenera sp.]MDP3776547.1 TetR family transcriptional regulator [Methylotenera sp.]PPD02070.1 MAG: TetR family transcriptional regulator [Methylotenera sp.]
MVRKTKEDAELTRQKIVNAARAVFLERGVSKSTLEHIASQANVTRGAVYWHFNNKAEIFHAIREQVFLPLIDRMDDTLAITSDNSQNPLDQIEASLCHTIHELNDNIEMREIYEIMMIKCEYVDEFALVLHQILNNCSSLIQKIEIAYERAQSQNILASKLTPRALALDTHLFFGGLLHMWIKDADGTKFRYQAIELIKSHINLRRK